MKQIFCLIFILIVFRGFAQTAGSLNVVATTSSAGGNFAPKNIMAIWIEDSTGNFVKTLLAYADKRIQYLNTWESSTNAKGIMYNRTDAITGATQTNHGTRTCLWNGLDYGQNEVADGKYYVCMELTDKHETGNYSKFAFIKGESNVVTPADVPSFSAVSIKWEKSGTTVAPLILAPKKATVFPNPTKGEITVSGKNITEIEVCSLSGTTILSYKASSKIDISNLENGIYLLKIRSGENWQIEKILKE